MQHKTLETILASFILSGLIFLGFLALDHGLQREEESRKQQSVCTTDTDCLDYAIRNGWDEEYYP